MATSKKAAKRGAKRKAPPVVRAMKTRKLNKGELSVFDEALRRGEETRNKVETALVEYGSWLLVHVFGGDTTAALEHRKDNAIWTNLMARAEGKTLRVSAKVLTVAVRIAVRAEHGVSLVATSSEETRPKHDGSPPGAKGPGNSATSSRSAAGSRPQLLETIVERTLVSHVVLDFDAIFDAIHTQAVRCGSALATANDWINPAQNDAPRVDTKVQSRGPRAGRRS